MLTFPLILAAVSAGLFGGFHCVAMCGGLAHLFSGLIQQGSTSKIDDGQRRVFKTIPITPIAAKELALQSVVPIFGHAGSGILSTNSKSKIYLHAGRLTSYALIGAFLGGVGAAAMGLGIAMQAHQLWYWLGNIVLILLGLRLLGWRMPRGLIWKFGKWRGLSRWTIPAAQGMARHPFVLGMSWGGLPCGLSYAVAPLALLSGAAWSGAVLMLLFGVAALPHLLMAQAMSNRLKAMPQTRMLQAVFALLLIAFGAAGLMFAEMVKLPVLLCLS